MKTKKAQSRKKSSSKKSPVKRRKTNKKVLEFRIPMAPLKESEDSFISKETRNFSSIVEGVHELIEKVEEDLKIKGCLVAVSTENLYWDPLRMQIVIALSSSDMPEWPPLLSAGIVSQIKYSKELETLHKRAFDAMDAQIKAFNPSDESSESQSG